MRGVTSAETTAVISIRSGTLPALPLAPRRSVFSGPPRPSGANTMDAMTRLQDRTWPAEGPARVPFWVYTDPDVYAREQERIFAGPTWCYVGAGRGDPEARRLQAQPSSARSRWSWCATPTAASTSWSTAARIAACGSAAPTSAPRRSSCAPTISGPTTCAAR